MSRTVLVTGSEGFIGRHLCLALAHIPELTLLKFGTQNTAEELAACVAAADFVFHLAGVMRPSDPEEFRTKNDEFTSRLIALLLSTHKRVPLLLSSSTQAVLDNPYGAGKRLAEAAVFGYGKDTGADVYVYRLTNIFGKWCRPNYNSAVTTWCHNIANGLPIYVRDPDAPLRLLYIDDVVNEFMAALDGRPQRQDPFCVVPTVYEVKLGAIVELLYAFKRSREDLLVPDQADSFVRKLYATYLTYLPASSLAYPLKMQSSSDGSLTEFLKTPDRGQLSISILKPHSTKENHWHHTKNEKVLVVSGRGVVRLRRTGEREVHEYCVSGDTLKVVDIPPGYSHHIENLGDTDLVTVMWCSDMCDSGTLDTGFESVEQGTLGTNKT